MAAYKDEKDDGVLDALLHGAGKGVSFGMSDRLQAVMGALGAKTADWGNNHEKRSFGEVYDDALKEARTEEDRRARQHSTAYTTGDVAGSVLSSLLLPAGKAVSAGDTALIQVAKGAGNAARTGALQGAGRSRKWGTDDVQGVLSDILKSAGVSAFAGGLMPGLGALANKLPGAGTTAGQNAGTKMITDLAKNAAPGEERVLSEAESRAAKEWLAMMEKKGAEKVAETAVKPATSEIIKEAGSRLAERVPAAMIGAAGGMGHGVGGALIGAGAGAVLSPLVSQGGKLLLREGPSALGGPALQGAVGAALPSFMVDKPPEPNMSVAPKEHRIGVQDIIGPETKIPGLD